MTTVEDRLRAATRAAAGTVADGSAPPLILPVPDHRRAAGWRRPRPRTRWLAPIAAVGAVAAITAGLIVATVPASVRKPYQVRTSAPVTLPAVQQTPPLADGLPAYFLAVPDRKVQGQGAASGFVDIVSTATGRTARKVTLPGAVNRIAADGAGAFYAAVLPRSGPLRFYRIAWPVTGGGVAVTALPVRGPWHEVDALAASPDGARLAIATYVQHGSTGYVQNLTVATTTTGAEHRWTAVPPGTTGSMATISWLADSRTLAFSWAYSYNSASGSLHLLDTTAPGSNLLGSQSVLPLNNPAGKFKDLAISETGRVLIGTSAYPAGPFGVVHGRPTALGDVISFSARTGAASFLYRPRAPSGSHATTFCEDPMWISPSGQQALLTCTRGSPGGQQSETVLLLGQAGATRLHRLERFTGSFVNLVAFGT